MRKNQLLTAVIVVCLLLLPLIGSAQHAPQDEHDKGKTVDHIMIYFPVGKSTVLQRFNSNATSLTRISKILSDPRIDKRLDSLVIQGSASLEGGAEFNQKLATARAEMIRAYIQGHNNVDKEKIKLYPGINWRGLEAAILADKSGVPNMKDVMQVVALPLNDQSKITQIGLLGNGEAMSYIQKKYATQMRSAVILIYANGGKEPINKLEPISDTVSNQMDDTQSLAPLVRVLSDSLGSGNATMVNYKRKPLFAFKTNLLYDLASAINIDIEVPIGKRWSVMAEVIFPWWLWSKDQICVQLFSAHLEGRYWFGNRDNRPQMTGWFAGVYAGGGYYDIETRTVGYQGESALSVGLTGGFAHTINRKGTLRMEYSLGVGYMYTDYRQYTPVMRDGDWLLKFQQYGHKSWIGPTKAKISLVWMIHGKKKIN